MKHCLIVIALLAVPASARAEILVDNFETSQNLAISPGTSSDENGVSAPGAISGARYSALGTAGGFNPSATTTVTINDSSNGILALTPNEDDAILMSLYYDGDTDSAFTPNGLGGLDLGTNLTFRILARSTAEVDASLFLYTGNLNLFSRFDFSFPGAGVDVPFSPIDIDVTSPSSVGNSGPFFPTLLGAVILTIDGQVTRGLVQIDHMSFVPEPSAAVLAAIGLAALVLGGRLRRRAGPTDIS